jgi:hypothetical protein
MLLIFQIISLCTLVWAQRNNDHEVQLIKKRKSKEIALITLIIIIMYAHKWQTTGCDDVIAISTRNVHSHRVLYALQIIL